MNSSEENIMRYIRELFDLKLKHLEDKIDSLEKTISEQKPLVDRLRMQVYGILFAGGVVFSIINGPALAAYFKDDPYHIKTIAAEVIKQLHEPPILDQTGKK